MRRSSKNIDSLIRQIIDKIDDQTTLLCFGDHGTKIDGSHGGEEVEEMRTAMFAYQKKPFPMMQTYEQNKDLFWDVDHQVKITDAAAILS